MPAWQCSNTVEPLLRASSVGLKRKKSIRKLQSCVCERFMINNLLLSLPPDRNFKSINVATVREAKQNIKNYFPLCFLRLCRTKRLLKAVRFFIALICHIFNMCGGAVLHCMQIFNWISRSEREDLKDFMAKNKILLGIS